MNTKRYITIAACGLCVLSATAQDELQTRHITVEHEFQPVVQQASKINRQPEALQEQEVEEQAIVWSEYVGSMDAGKNIAGLKGEETALNETADDTHGEIKGGIGHPQTLLDFRYKYGEKRNTLVLDVNHHAYWGDKLHEKTGAGFVFDHNYGKGNFRLGANGGNESFRYYGRLTEDKQEEIQSIWRFNLHMGAKSNEKQDLQYLVRAEYNLFSRVNSVVEHQINADINMAYRWGNNRAGINLHQQNQICVLSDSVQAYLDARGMEVNSRHALRMEPYYEWHNKSVKLHVGMNLDLNIGKGQMNSVKTDKLKQQVAFAPSPNVRIEAELMPKTVVLYGNFLGSLGYSSMPGYLHLNPYMNSGLSAASHHVSTYKPIDAEIGFRFRPIRTLLISAHGGYQYVKNGSAFGMGETRFCGADYAKYYYINYQRWKFGGQVDYHYRDIIDIHLWGDYYMYRGVRTFLNGAGDDDPGTETCIYDRPDWEMGAKIVGHIDNHWSVYTWDSFSGKRTNRTALGDKELPALVDLNLGAKYQFAQTGNKALDRLCVFLELRNFIHRKNMIWYGYESHGINGIAGICWSF